MKIKGVKVENFRGVRKALLENLQDLVVIAGQNGSGKSCILDAVRFLKSVYGGYQPNEYHQWFGEFQINFNNDPRAFARLLNDPAARLVLEIDIELHSSEREYLKSNAQRLITMQAWRTLVPELSGWRNLDAAPLTTQYRMREAEVKILAEKDSIFFEQEIKKQVMTATVFMMPGSMPEFTPSKVLELAFSQYEPDQIGIIDYHGAHRMFAREQLNTINVNLDAIEEQHRNSALYNYNTKYSNVKSEMAGLYVREALAAKAGVETSGEESLTKTLKELFSTFFPEKEFLGPQPAADGSLRFPVKVNGREEHDLDELSSGEKEILYGYLRLRSSTPRNSVILLDEPELHLNPRLTRNLPQFYHQHLSSELGNQVWLITHSDAILRNSVGRSGASVYHMTPSAYSDGQNQSRLIEADHDLERAIIDLVGDLAAYNPGAKSVIFEGEESEFDVYMATSLFPELAVKANLISGSNKVRVRGLHSLLERLQRSGGLPPMRVYSIVDKDSDIGDSTATTLLKWDRYHIENYLLEAQFIHRVLSDIQGSQLAKVEDVEAALLACARESVSALVVHQVSQIANRALVSAINTKIDPQSKDVPDALTAVIEASYRRIENLKNEGLSSEELKKKAQLAQDEFTSSFETEKWREVVRGRDVLKRLVGKHASGINYEAFRNLVIARMRDEGFQPKGMLDTLNHIMAPTAITSGH